MVSHLEQDILECEVKLAFRSIIINKASEGDVIPVEFFKILKDDAVKVLHSVCQQIWKTQQWPHWKRSVFILIPKKGNARMVKPPLNCTHFTCLQSNAQNSPRDGSTGIPYLFPEKPVYGSRSNS